MWGWWEELTSLVLPVACAGCGRGRVLLCAECRARLAPVVAGRVRPRPEPPGLPPVYACASYADEIRAVLLAHKERGALPLAAPLGEVLAAAVTGLLHATGGAPGGHRAVLQLVPVPSARTAVARRGHDPVRRIACAAAARLRGDGRAVRVHCALRLRRTVQDQAGLGRAQRRANLAGALTALPHGGRWGGPVVLVDDLMTTGASLAEAARAVRATRSGPAARSTDLLLGGAVVTVPENAG